MTNFSWDLDSIIEDAKQLIEVGKKDFIKAKKDLLNLRIYLNLKVSHFISFQSYFRN